MMVQVLSEANIRRNVLLHAGVLEWEFLTVNLPTGGCGVEIRVPLLPELSFPVRIQPALSTRGGSRITFVF